MEILDKLFVAPWAGVSKDLYTRVFEWARGHIRTVMTAPAIPISAPRVALSHLDQLWFQVAGTLCNLTCHHCFISCSPKNDAFGFLSLEDVGRRLDESISLGVKEYYFTGGEPFLNPEMTAILQRALHYGPVTVLTNGTVLKLSLIHI